MLVMLKLSFQGTKSKFLLCRALNLAKGLWLLSHRVDVFIMQSKVLTWDKKQGTWRKYLRCRPCHLGPKHCPGRIVGPFLALLSVNIFHFSIMGAKLKAKKHALWPALRSAACGGASHRCAAPSAAVRALRATPPGR